MPINRVVCPSCGAGLKSAAGFAAGQKIKCPKCQTAFAVPAPRFEEVPDEPEELTPARPAAGKPKRAVAVAVKDDEDDRPRKRKKKGGYKSSPLRFVVLGLLLTVLAVGSYFLFQKKKREKEADNAPVAAKNPDDGDDDKPGAKGTAGRKAAAPRATGPSQENAKRIAMAFHNHAAGSADGGTLPPAALYARNDAQKAKPLLSWRVAILPLLEQGPLHKKFKLDEPWDSEHNKALLASMPAVYRSPQSPAPDGETYFKVFVGAGALYDSKSSSGLSPSLNRMFDGTANTILTLEGGPPVPWTKPEDFAYDANGPLPDLTPPGGGDDVVVAMCDGSTRRFNRKTVSEKTLRAAITPTGGEKLGPDW